MNKLYNRLSPLALFYLSSTTSIGLIAGVANSSYQTKKYKSRIIEKYGKINGFGIMLLNLTTSVSYYLATTITIPVSFLVLEWVEYEPPCFYKLIFDDKKNK
jgi:hypothetical protein